MRQSAGAASERKPSADPLALNQRVPGSSPGAPTTQSSENADWQYGLRLTVFCGDLRPSFSGIRSVQVSRRLNDDFWRPVSSPQNSVPAG
jgi:hypothetical protein